MKLGGRLRKYRYIVASAAVLACLLVAGAANWPPH
jgi:hypothetical protein